MNSSQTIQKAQQILRKMKVLPIVEMFHYFLSVSKCYFKNKTFIVNNPQLVLPDELEIYQKEGLFIRGNIEEGKKMFWACHSPSYVTEVLFTNFEVLEHLPGEFPYTAQGYWILRR